MAGVASVLAPPRATGNAEADAQALGQYLFEIAKILASQQETITGTLGGEAGEIDVSDLPDPASTNLPTAQQTANDAYLLAAQAQTRALKFRAAGSVTISETDTTADFTFPTAEADTSYFVVVTPTAVSGAAAAGSNIIESVTKTTTKITLTINTDPGAGTSRTFDVAVFRTPA